MIKFEVDVSGEDLLNKDYTICIADNNSNIRGFKFNDEIVAILSSRYGQEFYKYSKSKKGKARFKVRLYCVVIYYLFKNLNLKQDISLDICRDFEGHESDIISNLNFLLKNKLKLNITGIHFVRLSKESNAHKYSFLMRQDSKNQMMTYVNIPLEELEKWL